MYLLKGTSVIWHSVVWHSVIWHSVLRHSVKRHYCNLAPLKKTKYKKIYNGLIDIIWGHQTSNMPNLYTNKRTCLIRTQDEYFASGTTMKVWKLVFLVILSVNTSVADQMRPTLLILFKNWLFFICFTKNNEFFTFIWVIP